MAALMEQCTPEKYQLYFVFPLYSFTPRPTLISWACCTTIGAEFLDPLHLYVLFKSLLVMLPFPLMGTEEGPRKNSSVQFLWRGIVPSPPPSTVPAVALEGGEDRAASG